jgi:hypothetical protein
LRTRWISTLLLLAALGCRHGGVSAPGADPDLVLPGAFSEQTTMDDLRARFGAANVTPIDDPDAPGATLFASDPTRRATVRFYDAERTHLASVTVSDPETRWRGKLGVGIGTTLAELRRLNAAEFWFVRFDAQGDATVRDAWNAGALDVTEGDRLYFGVDLRALPGAPAPLPAEEGTISSEDPRCAALGEHVAVSAITAWSSLDDEW